MQQYIFLVATWCRHVAAKQVYRLGMDTNCPLANICADITNIGERAALLSAYNN
jgi:hypothetical protein